MKCHNLRVWNLAQEGALIDGRFEKKEEISHIIASSRGSCGFQIRNRSFGGPGCLGLGKASESPTPWMLVDFVRNVIKSVKFPNSGGGPKFRSQKMIVGTKHRYKRGVHDQKYGRFEQHIVYRTFFHLFNVYLYIFFYVSNYIF